MYSVTYGCLTWIRFVTLSCPGCPSTVDEPEPEDTLPTDDALWDEGVCTCIFGASSTYWVR